MRRIFQIATICLTVLSVGHAFASDKCLGLYINNSPTFEELQMKKSLGVTPCVINLFWGFNEISSPDVSTLQTIWKSGALPMITLEPWDAKTKTGPSLQQIASGSIDAKLEKFASALKAFKHPVAIRFAHEMNGNWYPWTGEKNGRDAANYIAAYKHVHDFISKQCDASKLIWIFSVNWENVPNESWNDALKYYPGDEYVSAIGIDGYNWGTSEKWARWREFKELFSVMIDNFSNDHTAKPIIITEVSTASAGGSDLSWIDNMFAFLGSGAKNVKALVWFDISKENDWRIDREPRFGALFREKAKGVFNSNRATLINSLKDAK